jgi:hypothetical protein
MKIKKQQIWRRLRFTLLIPLIIIGFFGFWAISWIGPWHVDQDYFPPHLIWDGDETMATSITCCIRTPQSAQLELIYAPELPDGSYGPEIKISENSSKTYHFIRLSGLTNNTKYKYYINELTNNLNNRVRSDLVKPYIFKTASNIKNESFQFVVFGDNRPNVFGSSTNKEIDKEIRADSNNAFTINTGDLVMIGGGPRWLWRRYFLENEHMRSMISLPSKGNHEVYLAEDDPENTEYEFNHAFPGHTNYYSFNYSNTHFICLDFSSSNGPESLANQTAMKSWLRKDLARINESDDIDWVFINQHYPLHTSLGSNGVNMGKWNSLVGSEFDLANVIPDVLFAGHVHDYERSWVDLGDLDGDGKTDGVWNIISGGGGAEIVPVQWDDIGEDEESLVLQNHYCSIKINGNSIDLTAKMINGVNIDNLTYTKGVI